MRNKLGSIYLSDMVLMIILSINGGIALSFAYAHFFKGSIYTEHWEQIWMYACMLIIPPSSLIGGIVHINGIFKRRPKQP